MNRRKSHLQGTNAGYHLTLQQMTQIIGHSLTLRERVLLQTLVETGLRRSEIADLGIVDVRWAEQLLVIRQGKGNKMRLVPITQNLKDNMKSLTGDRGQGAVFVSRKGKSLSVRQVNRIVAESGKRAGVENPNPKYRQITCHLFRHSFARLWKEKEGSIESLSRILGHESVKTTWDLYGSESLNDIRRNYDKMMRKMSTDGPVNYIINTKPNNHSR